MKRVVELAVLVVAAGSPGLAAAGDIDDSHAQRAPPSFVPTSSRQRVGVISGEAEGEYVAVQGKECGVPGAFFRSLGGASTNEVGGWEARFFVRTKTQLRAAWGKDVSST